MGEVALFISLRNDFVHLREQTSKNSLQSLFCRLTRNNRESRLSFYDIFYRLYNFFFCWPKVFLA